jgi:hypothetical protein
MVVARWPVTWRVWETGRYCSRYLLAFLFACERGGPTRKYRCLEWLAFACMRGGGGGVCLVTSDVASDVAMLRLRARGGVVASDEVEVVGW